MLSLRGYFRFLAPEHTFATPTRLPHPMRSDLDREKQPRRRPATRPDYSRKKKTGGDGVGRGVKGFGIFDYL